MASNGANLEIDAAVKQYYDSISSYKVLTKDEEHELLREYKYNNNIAARNKLITSNLRYACKLANAYRNRGVSYSELISVANDGLLESIEKFDIEQDIKLISYSKWWIMQKMQNAIIKKNRMPESDIPGDHEDQYDEAEVDEPAKKSKQDAYNEYFVVDDDNLEDEKNAKKFIDGIMSVLTEREADIINMYYGRCGHRENTLEDIGKKYNLTKERVRQIMEVAFKKIRSESMLLDNKYLSR